jgi:diguanylate cyclase (GGDEF)-like protein/PAS domain S-box-containing protein
MQKGFFDHYRILAMVAFLLIFVMIFLPQGIASRFYQEMEKQREASLRKIIEVSYNAVKPVLQQVASGEISIEEGRRLTADMIREMTYQDEFGMNYIFMLTLDGALLVQPYLQQPEGTILIDLQDSKGKYYFREMVQALQLHPHGAFVDYYYLPPNKDTEEKKLSYIMSLPEIDAFIGTGAYLDSSYLHLNQIMNTLRWSFVGLTFLITLFLGFNVFFLARQNRALLKEITEHQSTGKKLQTSEAKYRTLFYAANDGILVIEDGLIVDCNQMATVMFGTDKSFLLGKSPAELSPPLQRDGTDSVTLANSSINKALQGISQQFEWVHWREDGSLFDSEVSLSMTSVGGTTYILAIVRDITERKNAEQEIRKLAYSDPLTGLPNRLSIIGIIRRNTESCHFACHGTLFYIDVDEFKVINDTLSHSVGDQLLIRIADILQATFINDDHYVLGRLGGDEFVLICDPKLSDQGVVATAENIGKLFEVPIHLNEYSFKIGVSIGIVHYPEHGDNPELLLKNADLAMYEAKKAGRNCFRIYHEDMSLAFSQKVNMEKSINSALANRELEVYYQPQIDLLNGAISGFEALLRWQSEEYGPISPAEFIPLAEKTGAINEIGFWVFEEACRFAQDMIGKYGKVPTITVNFSPVQFLESELFDRLFAIYHSFALSEKSIGIEITENLLIDSGEDTIPLLAALRDNGFRIYLDDFGTGYSSLNYLKILPIDVVKIDKTFIDDVVSNVQSGQILSTIIELGHTLGLRMVAEGVETKSQLDFLRTKKCNCIQGYYFSRPLHKAAAIEYAATREIKNCSEIVKIEN